MARRFAIGSAIIIACASLAAAVVGVGYLDRTAAKVGCGKQSTCRDAAKHLAPVHPGKPQTILVIGSDVRKRDRELGYRARSDTLILVRLDPDTGRISMLSLPRDLKVMVPGKGINKINAAYADGGVTLTLNTVKALTGLKINHFVNVNFRGFKDAVNAIGCVYFDVDQRYYHSNAGLPIGAQYAEINVPPGYQKLCGQDALDFARYRHTDGDLIRGIRQQAFLREAKRTIGTGRLFDERDKLIDIFAKNTTSDIGSSTALLRVVKLVLASANAPFHSVKLDIGLTKEYVTASPYAVQKAIREFLGTDLKREHKKAKHKKKKRKTSGLVNVEVGKTAGIEQVAYAAPRVGFPVLYPKLREKGSQYQGTPRVYTLRGSDNHKYMAVKLVLKTAGGSYYGVMETSWKGPPILQEPSETLAIKGRMYMLYYDQKHLRLVAFKTKKAVYWISNTLDNKLSSKDMLKIAVSMRRAN